MKMCIRDSPALEQYGILADYADAVLEPVSYTHLQGVIKAEDMSSDPNFNILEDVKTGDTIEATVVKTDDGEGNILLSKKLSLIHI